MLDGSKKITSLVINRDCVLAVEGIKRGDRLSSLKTAEARLMGAASSSVYANALSELKRSCGLKGRVALSLPDTFARTLILEFDELPSKKAEALEVVRWKAAKQLYLRPEECRVDYQTFNSSGSIKALVLVAKEKDILAVEQALESSGIIADKINIHSLNLINLISVRNEPDTDASIILGMEGYITIMFLRGGSLDFYRCKEIEGAARDGLNEMVSTISYYNGRNSGFIPARTYIFSDDQVFKESARKFFAGRDIQIVISDYLAGKEAGAPYETDQTSVLTAFGAAF